MQRIKPLRTFREPRENAISRVDSPVIGFKHTLVRGIVLWRIVPANVRNYLEGVGIEVETGNTTCPDGEIVIGFPGTIARYPYSLFKEEVLGVPFYLNVTMMLSPGPTVDSQSYQVTKSPLFELVEREAFVSEFEDIFDPPPSVTFSLLIGRVFPIEKSASGNQFVTEQKFMGEVVVDILTHFESAPFPDPGVTSGTLRLQ